MENNTLNLFFIIIIATLSCGKINLQDTDNEPLIENQELEEPSNNLTNNNGQGINLVDYLSIKSIENNTCFQSKITGGENTRKKIKIEPFKWELISLDSLYTYEVTKEMEKSGDFKKIEFERILTPSYIEAYFSSSKDNDELLEICFREIPAKKDKAVRYELLNKDLKVEKKKFHYPQRIIVSPQKITIVPKEYENIVVADEETRWMKEGEWTEWHQHEKSNSKRNENQQIKKVQQKLMDKGYDVKITNAMDEKTKKAILEFQTDRGLQKEGLNSATLLELGVE